MIMYVHVSKNERSGDEKRIVTRGIFRDVRKVDRARAIISVKEISLLMRILQEGIDIGVFRIGNVKERAIIITNCIHGMDVPYIRNTLSTYGIDKDRIVDMVSDLILNGIKNDKK